jgi:hypothetical protein
MAGAGYKLFSTGDVLSASDVNTYLQQQTVMVFASAAARTTALASVLAEGMVTYLKDTDVVEIYTGAAWVSLDDPNAIQNSIVDAKGDIITATADNTPARLAVGTNGQTLVADSSTATGLKWATPATAASGLTFINRTTFSAQASVTIDSIFTSTYESYLIVIERIQGTTGSDDLQMQLRVGASTTTSNYFGTTVRNTTSAIFANSANVSQFTLADNIGKTNQPDQLNFIITNVGNSSEIPTYSGTGVEGETPGGVILMGGTNMTAATYTGILLKPSAGTMTGEVTIYGLAKS